MIRLETGNADVDLKDTSGRIPSLWAFANGYESVAQDLLDTGRMEAAPENTFCRTPLWWAAKNGQEAVVKLLLETGKVDVNLNDGSGPATMKYFKTMRRRTKTLLFCHPIGHSRHGGNGLLLANPCRLRFPRTRSLAHSCQFKP
jgi:hypothetical protein